MNRMDEKRKTKAILCPKCGQKVKLTSTDGVKCPHCYASISLKRKKTDAPAKSMALSESDISQVKSIWGSDVAVSYSPGMSMKVGNLANPSLNTLTLNSYIVLPKKENESKEGKQVDFRIDGLLGKGGMGKVYSAYQASLKRKVALKILKPELRDNEDMKAKFIAEALLTGELEHPGIIPIYEVARSQNDELFYTMKEVKGKPWKATIESTSLPDNLKIWLDVAEAMSFAHSKSILHRDLKPENIMVGSFGEVLVMDWGLAMNLDAKEQYGALAKGGTPAYMAPEMARGEIDKLDIRSDVYLMGAILYEIVTGVRPHSAPEILPCLCQAIKNEIQETSHQGELVDIAMKAMSTLPEDRYQTISEFITAIKGYQEHAESIYTCNLAEKDLKTARMSKKYDDFSKAVFGFKNSIEMWSDNKRAIKGLKLASFEYAEVALKGKDFELALNFLDSECPLHAELIDKVIKEKAESEQEEQKDKNLKKYLVSAAGIFLAFLTIMLLWVYNEKNNALEMANAAKEAEVKADELKKIAEEEKDKAQKALLTARQSDNTANKALLDLNTSKENIVVTKKTIMHLENENKSLKEQVDKLTKENVELKKPITNNNFVKDASKEEAINSTKNTISIPETSIINHNNKLQQNKAVADQPSQLQHLIDKVSKNEDDVKFQDVLINCIKTNTKDNLILDLEKLLKYYGIAVYKRTDSDSDNFIDVVNYYISHKYDAQYIKINDKNTAKEKIFNEISKSIDQGRIVLVKACSDTNVQIIYHLFPNNCFQYDWTLNKYSKHTRYDSMRNDDDDLSKSLKSYYFCNYANKFSLYIDLREYYKYSTDRKDYKEYFRVHFYETREDYNKSWSTILQSIVGDTKNNFDNLSEMNKFIEKYPVRKKDFVPFKFVPFKNLAVVGYNKSTKELCIRCSQTNPFNNMGDKILWKVKDFFIPYQQFWGMFPSVYLLLTGSEAQEDGLEFKDKNSISLENEK